MDWNLIRMPIRFFLGPGLGLGTGPDGHLLFLPLPDSVEL